MAQCPNQECKFKKPLVIAPPTDAPEPVEAR